MPGPFAWTPTPEHLERSNVARFMRRHGLDDYESLVRRSIDDIAWFWFAAVEDLGLEFTEPYSKVLDDSAGPAWAKWFLNGRINVAQNCVDRHALGPRADAPAILWEGEDGATRSLSYGELKDETARLSNVLRSLGVAKGERVGIYLPMIPEAAVALFAVARIGAIAVPIFSGFGAKAVADRLIDAEAKVLISADGYLRKGQHVGMKAIADEARALSPTVCKTLVVRRLGGDGPWSAEHDLDYRDALASARPDGSPLPMDPEDPFLIAYTSGTTGKPKGAVHVHGGFLAKIAQEVAHQVDMTPDDVLFWFTDLGWIMGPWELVGGLARGGTVLLYEGSPDRPGPDRLWRLVERHRVSILGVSPTLIRALMRHGTDALKGYDLASLRILASTGEPWNDDPWWWYFRHVGGERCPIINLSGGTEVGACFLSPLSITPLKPCTLGGPSLGMAVDVVDPHGDSIRGAVGELVCRKPWPGMTRGLWNAPERYRQAYWSRFPGLWTHGDWASVDADGLWFLHGRSDDTLNVAGKRIGPVEIETVIVNHPGASEAAAIGVPHELKGDVVWCFVVPSPGFEPDEALRSELSSSVVEALGKSFAPGRIVFVRELPRTRSAKILRRAIRSCVTGGEPGDLSGLENPAALDAIRDDLAADRPAR